MKPRGWKSTTYLTGLYVGEVISRDDEENLSRVQVRVLGVHESDTGAPWALPAKPLMGDKQFTVPAVGTWVYVLFINGNPLRPLYFGQVEDEELGDSESNKYGFAVSDDSTVVEILVDKDNKEVRVGATDDDWTIKITGGTVEIGNGVLRRLLNAVAGAVYNGHTHRVRNVRLGGSTVGTTGPRQRMGNAAATSDTKAS